MYGCSGFIVDVDDPDSTHTYDDVWDMMINKDVTEGHDILSIDTGVLAGSPEFEPGKLDLFEIFGDNLVGNVQIYKRRELLSFPKRPVSYDTSNDTYFPMDAFKIHIANGPRVTRPSVAMFGFSCPNMQYDQDISGNEVGSTPSEAEWLYTMFAEVFLYDMWKHLIGITGGSTVAPYDAVSAWFAELLEDRIWEEPDGNAFTESAMLVHTKATWDFSVVGKPKNPTLTSD